MPSTTIPQFDIRNFVARLTPAKGKNRYHCPVCEGDNLTFDLDNYQGYTCWNDESEKHRAEIREVVSPWSEVANQGNSVQNFTQKLRQPVQKQSSTLAQPPEQIRLAQLPDPATDAPQPQEKSDYKRGKVLVTTYQYSETQWVERIQWDNPEKPKGYSKDFFPYHLGEDGKPVCKKGDADWLPYRWEEAIQATKATGANALLMVEGEGCVEAYRSLSFAAVTLQGSGWNDAELRVFAYQVKAHGLTLVFHPDNDTTGEQKAGKLQRACELVGVCCLILNPLNLCAELPKSGDVVDILKMVDVPDYVKRLEAEIHAAMREKQSQRDTQSTQSKQNQKLQDDPIKAAGMAAELAEAYRSTLAWNDEGQSWYRYEADSPGVWSAESEISVGAVILAEIEARIGLNYTANYLNEVVKLLKHKLLVRNWEEPKGMLPFKNGVLKWETGEFLPHSPGYRFTYVIPRDYSILATNWGTIEAWMDEATGNNSKLKNILLCWLNASLKGRSDLQRFLHLVGPGGTGKGTFMRLAIDLIGKRNHHSSSLQDWCGNRFESANAYKKRLVVFSDEDKYSGGLGNFKKLTGGDALRGEVKNKTAFHYTFEGMVMVASNYPIFAGDSSSGMARRVLMIPFNNVVSPGQRRNLEAEFEAELSALTNYVLSIPDEIVTQTLQQSVDQAPEVIETTWEYRMRMDSVTAWLNECVIFDPLASERVGVDKADVNTLFGSYYQYCDRTGSRAKGNREFSPALLDLVNNILHWDVEKKRVSSGFIIQGLRLRTPADLAEPYCIEALSTLSHVGSTTHVESDVGSDVESKALPEAGHVACVGPTNSSGEIQNTEPCVENSESGAEISKVVELSPYTSYTSQSEEALEPYSPTLHMQDDDPALLDGGALRLVLEAMAGIKSVLTFERFKLKFQQLTDAQQRQVWEVASPELKQKYGHWLNEFVAIPQTVWEARKALLRVINAREVKQLQAQFDRDTLNQAYKLIHPSTRKELKSLINEAKNLR
jgi:P4 family phage/plasmid primase-like protien